MMEVAGAAVGFDGAPFGCWICILLVIVIDIDELMLVAIESG